MKLDRGVERDQVCELRDAYKILNDRDKAVKADQAFWYIKTFDDYYDHQKIIKWFEIDGKVTKMTDKNSRQGLGAMKLYN